jgi:hypothetical protein
MGQNPARSTKKNTMGTRIIPMRTPQRNVRISCPRLMAKLEHCPQHLASLRSPPNNPTIENKCREQALEALIEHLADPAQ